MSNTFYIWWKGYGNIKLKTNTTTVVPTNLKSFDSNSVCHNALIQIFMLQLNTKCVAYQLKSC